MNLQQIDITGSRLIGAITDLGHVGPKHHGIVIGEHALTKKIYVAENNHTGYQLATIDDFIERYSPKANIVMTPNNGEFSDLEVAQRALKEVIEGGKAKYNLVVNNCESFSNRAMYDKDFSQQIINSALLLFLAAGTVWYIKQAHK